MSATFIAGLIQVNATNELAPNIAFIEEQTRRARDAGADFVMTPENSTLIGANRGETLAKALPEAEHPGLASAQAIARECGVWFLVGSIHVKVEAERNANRSYLVAPDGGIVASYDKIHMFDVQLTGGETYRESSTFRPGDKAVIAETPWGKLGMTICYDLRFPSLYRTLAHGGAEMLSIPSSFTVPTGRAHWHTLMRARAIETGCYIFAPAQVGSHAGNRKTYGHSVVVAPWGEVIADAGDTGPGFVTARIDMAKVAEARQAVPSLTHDRSYSGPTVRTCALPKAAE
ncbi:MAG: carbon-nitrogen hydrolase family protein [Alphaproteobacteria bacterium]|nr:carbon-nitrogen hydrolase family protein [Alphaproteobacteria bacterium]